MKDRNKLKKIAKRCRILKEETGAKSRNKHHDWNSLILEIDNLAQQIFPARQFRSPTHKLSEVELEINRSFEGVEAGGVTCECCGIYTRLDIKQHLKQHNISVEDYKNKFFGADVVSSSTKAKYSERIKGENNPGYQHGGRFSAVSTNFVGYRGMSKEETEANIKKVGTKIGNSNVENGNNDTTLIYYTSKGYSIEESNKMLKERQTTFSLDKCIEQYGVDEGNARWKARQDKWQTTLKSKSKEEIERINSTKGSDRNGVPHPGGYFNLKMIEKRGIKDDPCILYYIRFYNEDRVFYKIGITNKSVGDRFPRNSCPFEYEILSEKNGTVLECFLEEQQILRDNKEFRINIDHNGFRTTEAFSKDINI